MEKKRIFSSRSCLLLWLACVLFIVAGGTAWAGSASAENTFVTVGVTANNSVSIVDVGNDFYIGTEDSSVEVTIAAKDDFDLVKPDPYNPPITINAGDSEDYAVEGIAPETMDGSGTIYFVKVEFDNVWDRNIDPLAAGNFPDYEKCIAIEWDSAGKVDLENYLKIEPNGLTFDDVDDVVSLDIETPIFGNGSINGSLLDYANTDPGDTDIYAFAVRLLCGGDVVDRLIVVIYDSDTEDEYNGTNGTGGWVANNPVNPAWLAELPAVHPSLGASNADPEPGAPKNWGSPNVINNNYHYSAVREMRSGETPGGHGHQACYDGNGALIQNDGAGDQIEERLVACGTADERHWSDQVFPPTHRTSDVYPFIRAAQLDGNPVDGLGALNNPLIRLGSNLQAYFDRRPPHTANQVVP